MNLKRADLERLFEQATTMPIQDDCDGGLNESIVREAIECAGEGGDNELDIIRALGQIVTDVQDFIAAIIDERNREE